MGFLDKINPAKIAEEKIENAKLAAKIKMDSLNPVNIAKNKAAEAKYAAKAKASELGNKAKDAAVDKAKQGASFVGGKAKKGAVFVGNKAKEEAKKQVNAVLDPYKTGFKLVKGLLSKDKGQEVQAAAEDADVITEPTEPQIAENSGEPAPAQTPMSFKEFEDRISKMKDDEYPAWLETVVLPQDCAAAYDFADAALYELDYEWNWERTIFKEYYKNDPEVYADDYEEAIAKLSAWGNFLLRVCAPAENDDSDEAKDLKEILKKAQKKYPEAFL